MMKGFEVVTLLAPFHFERMNTLKRIIAESYGMRDSQAEQIREEAMAKSASGAETKICDNCGQKSATTTDLDARGATIHVCEERFIMPTMTKTNKPKVGRNDESPQFHGRGGLECCVKDCSVDMVEILGIFDDGSIKMVLCPNHQIMYVLGLLKQENMDIMPSTLTEKITCELCEAKSVLFEESETTYELCSHHMEKLIRKNLSRDEFSKLYLKHGNTFLLHDDFYDDDGEATQPVES